MAGGEEVVDSFRASFGGWRLEEVLHTAAVLRRRRIAASGLEVAAHWA
jgi:hypothetical protein